jgi:hypothetical protein
MDLAAIKHGQTIAELSKRFDTYPDQITQVDEFDRSPSQQK